MKSKVTIREVAAAAGVSIGTASRALNRTGRVSAEAVATVSRVARELGYQPNAVAQSLRTRSTGVAGLLVSDISNPLYASIANAVEERLVASGLTLLVASTHGQAGREKSLIDLFRRRRIDGLVLAACELEQPGMLDRLAAEFPVVALDRDVGAQGACVHVGHRDGAFQATRYLLNLGHRRIALLTPGERLRPGRERIAGFTDAYTAIGEHPDKRLIRAEQSSMEYSFSEALSLLSMKDGPTAFLCLGTRILSGVLQAVRHAGRSIPDDLSIISVGDTDLTRLFSPPITSLTWDLNAMGTACAEVLLRRIASPEAAGAERIIISTQIILRDSCGPAPVASTPPPASPSPK